MKKKKLQLNIRKIESEMRRLNEILPGKVNKSWLARQMGVTPAVITYLFKNRPISYANQMGEIFDCDPKDMIVNE